MSPRGGKFSGPLIALTLALGASSLAPSLTSPAAAQEATEARQAVRIRVLDKITARTRTFDLRVGASAIFNALTVTARTCVKNAPSAPAEAAAFLEIEEKALDGNQHPVFSGWMFASSPALSAMEHAVYDVWVLQCLPD